MEGISKAQARTLLVVRLIMGWGFLFAGLEKIFDLGGSGKPFSAVGFLKFATGGGWPGVVADAQGNLPVVNPTHDFWVSLAGNGSIMPIINFLVVFGETAIGICLILGLATRFASLFGVLMMSLFFVAAWSFTNGIVNEQLVYLIATATLGVFGAGRYYGLDAVVEKFAIVQRYPALHYALG